MGAIKCLLIGAAATVTAVVFVNWIRYRIEQDAKSRATPKAAAEVLGDAKLSPCQKAARARAEAQGAVGTIPLSYVDAPMAAFYTNPEPRLPM